MKTARTRLSMTLMVIFILAACKEEDVSPSNSTTGTGTTAQTKGITTSAEAKKAYSTIKSFVDGFESKLTSSYATTTVNGDKGKATIYGRKTSSSSSTSTSSTSTSTIDMDVTFTDYSSASMLVTGAVENYDYDYYRMSCSISTCADSNTVNEYIKGTSVKVEFTHDGKKIKETITIDVKRTSSYGTLSGKLTTSTGSSFTI